MLAFFMPFRNMNSEKEFFDLYNKGQNSLR